MKTKLISVIMVMSIILTTFSLTVSAEGYVAEGNGGIKYTSIGDAIDAAGDAEVIDIKLLQDTTEWVDIVTGISRTINIDLNGHSVYGIYNAGATVNITDAVGTGGVNTFNNEHIANIYGGHYELIKHYYGTRTNIYDCKMTNGCIDYESYSGAINVYGGTYDYVVLLQTLDMNNMNIYDGVFKAYRVDCTVKPKVYGGLFSTIDATKMDCKSVHPEVFWLYGGNLMGYGDAGLNRVIDMYDPDKHDAILIHDITGKPENTDTTYIVDNFTKFKELISSKTIQYYTTDNSIYVNGYQVYKVVNPSSDNDDAVIKSTTTCEAYNGNGKMYNDLGTAVDDIINEGNNKVYVVDGFNDVENTLSIYTGGVELNAGNAVIGSITNHVDDVVITGGTYGSIQNFGTITLNGCKVVDTETDWTGRVQNHKEMLLNDCNVVTYDNYGVAFSKNGVNTRLLIDISYFTWEEGTYKGIIAAYNKAGELTFIEVTDVTGQTQIDKSMTLGSEIDKMKFMLWQDFNGMAPMSKAYEFKIN